MKLIKKEDMAEPKKNNGNEKSDENIYIKVCEVSKHAQALMGGFYEGVVAMLRAYGFNDIILAHPRNGYDVTYFFKGETVIIVDSYANYFTAEALGKEDSKWFFDSVKSNPCLAPLVQGR